MADDQRVVITDSSGRDLPGEDAGGSQNVNGADVLALLDQTRAELARANQDRDRFRQERDAADGGRRSAVESQFTAQETAATSEIAAAKAEQRSAAADYAKAMEEQNFGAAAEAQIRISKATAAEYGAGQRVEWLKGQKAHVAKAQPVRTETTRTESASTNNDNLSDAARAWIDRNPRFKTDPAFQARATAAHYEAIESGHGVDSPGYFAHIEGAAYRRPTGSGGGLGGGGAAAVTRSGAMPGQARQGDYRLTAEQADAADSLFSDEPDVNQRRLKYAQYLENPRLQDMAKRFN